MKKEPPPRRNATTKDQSPLNEQGEPKQITLLNATCQPSAGLNEAEDPVAIAGRGRGPPDRLNPTPTGHVRVNYTR